MKSKWFGLLPTMVFVAGFTGCAHNPTTLPPGPIVSGFGNPGGCDSCSRFPNLPRNRLAPAPVVVPPAPVPVPAPGVPPPGAPSIGGPVDNLRNYPPADNLRNYPPADSAFKPAPEARYPNPEVKPPSIRLQQPEIGEATAPQKPARDSILPVDIPGFSLARKDVASGQKPFTEGLDWLRTKGYKAVLYVKSPGEDDRLARQQFEAKGFRYINLDVSPVTLTKETVEEFNRIVTDATIGPLFVFDRDSSLVGGLWYLHFRVSEGYNDEKAAIEAGRLGLNIDADGGSHREMWLAIQRYLQTVKPTARFGRIHTASWIKTSQE